MSKKKNKTQKRLFAHAPLGADRGQVHTVGWQVLDVVMILPQVHLRNVSDLHTIREEVNFSDLELQLSATGISSCKASSGPALLSEGTDCLLSERERSLSHPFPYSL